MFTIPTFDPAAKFQVSLFYFFYISLTGFTNNLICKLCILLIVEICICKYEVSLNYFVELVN